MEDRRHKVMRNHPHVGEPAEVSEVAEEDLRPLRGELVTIVGVLLQGDQILGYQVRHESGLLVGAKKDFYVGRYLLEDIYVDSPRAQQIKRCLKSWQQQRSYWGPRWGGIEAFHYDLAKVTSQVSVESAGWYKYRTSTRPDMDGKDWRLVVPEPLGSVVVNCHSLLHDRVWTLTTTVFSTREIDPNELVLFGSEDHWERTLLWSYLVATALETHGYDYADAKEGFQSRLRANSFLRQVAQKIEPDLVRAFGRVFGYRLQVPPYSIGFARWKVAPDHIASYDDPDKGVPYGIISVHPKASQDWGYVEEVVKHELIHHILTLVGQKREHGRAFQQMARLLQLPEKYRD